jgi:hypothetical protein
MIPNPVFGIARTILILAGCSIQIHLSHGVESAKAMTLAEGVGERERITRQCRIDPA